MKGPAYLSYLLRLWRVEDSMDRDPRDATVWRGSLEGSLSGERHGFSSLGELFDLLLQQTGAAVEPGRASSGAHPGDRPRTPPAQASPKDRGLDEGNREGPPVAGGSGDVGNGGECCKS